VRRAVAAKRQQVCEELEGHAVGGRAQRRHVSC
jgi:hypothetical protein